MARQTVSIYKLLETVNYRNQHSTCAPEVREGWNSILENILMDAEVYGGFMYLDETQVPKGHLPGIVRNTEKPEGPHRFPDETRRVYYGHRKLKVRK